MSAESVKVLVRCRPVNQREMSLGGKTVVTMDPARGQCSIVNPADLKAAPKTFTFDGAYGMDSTTEQIYSEIVFPLVENVLEGYNGTVFAYGQTGSGKSFSMQGPEGVPVQKGVIPRTFEHIFEATATTENMKFLVCASYLEIYNEEVRDLLGRDIKQKLEIKEHPEKGIYVAGLSMHTVNNIKECDEFMQKGLKSRATGSTLMNADSSRSHSIFTVHLEMMETRDDGEHIKTTKLHLVDLAGSERQAKTGATGERLKEATKINLSLSALGNVISALVDGKSSHIPYRDSKLTRLLQDSLGGNTKTIMIACLSPADNNYDESLSTLRYANRAKNIKNKPKINEDPKDALLREYQEEIKRLKSIIGGGGEGGVPAALDPEALEKEKQKIKEEYQTEVENLKKQYKEEQVSKSKLQEEMSKLKKHFEEQITNVGQKSPKKTGMMAPSSSPTHGMSTDTQAEEALKKLEMLQQKMVGGEQVNNEALKQQRKRKKTEAEKRKQKLAEALLKIDSDDPMMQVYTSVQEKLDAVNKQYEKEKKKSKSLESEIRDLQSEFELDRIDYLDTIRRQDQQLKLFQQILDKVQPCLRRDSNYANLEKIKKEAQWDEDLQKWHLPEVTVVKTQFPNGNLGGAGGVMQGGRQPNHHASVSPRISNGYQGAVEDADDDRLRSKLEASSAENIAGNYFKPVRSTNIMSKTEQDKNRNIDNKSTYFPEFRNTWDNLMNGVIYTNDIYERQGGGGGGTGNTSYAGNANVKKPAKLESLGNNSGGNNGVSSNQLSSAKKFRKKPNDIDVIFTR